MSDNKEGPRGLPCPPHPIPQKKEYQEGRKYVDFRLRRDWILNLILLLTWMNCQTVLDGFRRCPKGIATLRTVAPRAVWDRVRFYFIYFSQKPWRPVLLKSSLYYPGYNWIIKKLKNVVSMWWRRIWTFVNRSQHSNPCCPLALPPSLRRWITWRR